MQRLLPFFLFLLLYTIVPARAETILVVPFVNESSSANLDWISEAFAVGIREALQARGLLALNRDDRVEAYRRLSIRPQARLTRASVIKLAEALDADTVVHGSFQLTAAPQGSLGTLRVTTYLLDTRSLRKGPEFLESGALEDLAAIQARVAWQVLRRLAPESAPTADQFLKEAPPVRLDALENYIRGLLAATPEQKHRYFTQAARLDERFSRPRFELGRLYWEQKEYRLAARWLGEVTPSDPRYLEGQFLLGLCRYYLADYAGAQTAFEAVAASLPLNEVFNNLGAAQSRRHLPGALENFRKALEGDSADPDYHFNVGYALWKAGDFNAAAASFRAALQHNPEDTAATLMLGRCLARTAPRPGDLQGEARERIKLNYEESAYRQLKAALEGLRPSAPPK